MKGRAEARWNPEGEGGRKSGKRKAESGGCEGCGSEGQKTGKVYRRERKGTQKRRMMKARAEARGNAEGEEEKAESQRAGVTAEKAQNS